MLYYFFVLKDYSIILKFILYFIGCTLANVDKIKSKIVIKRKILNIFKGPEGKRGQQGRRGPKVS